MKAAEAAEPYLVDLPDSYPRRPHESFPPAVSVVRGPRCPPSVSAAADGLQALGSPAALRPGDG